MKSQSIFLALLILGMICPFVKAEPITIVDNLSGDRVFRGFPIKNSDGSTTYLGLSYRGDVIEGDLPGEWAVVMKATHPQKWGIGNVLGLFAVGIREAGVFGSLTGTIDYNPQGGEFSFIIAISKGTGPYEGFTGVGYFNGFLSDKSDYIEGNLSLILSSGGPEVFSEEQEKKYDGNPALLLLE